MSNYEGVAVVGFGARLPGARNALSFWSLLQERRCSIGQISADRFSQDGFYHPSSGQKGRSYTFAAGLIDDVWGFDAAAFGMSPREAEQVDPQQRQLLEVTFDALAHAGIKASSLAGPRTGVFVGASSLDYGARFFSDPSAADVHMMTGNTLSILSNRISYVLNAKGPSFTVDTACSSSLVALSLASDAVRSGSVDTAIVAGVNLLLSPFSFVGFSRASMLSPSGLCRPFDAGADGYVRAEGVIVLVLRSLAAARSSSNRVHATVLGTGVGQDGRTTGLSLPSSQSQQELLERVYEDAGIDPADLAFVEAHGTGTRVGDPIEANALGKALGQRRSQPLPIGSVKSNIGHLEPASGLAGILKSILALNERILPATLHQSSPNADIPFDELNLRVVDRNWRLPEVRGPALAGVNSFGFGGTNAHVILQAGETNVRAVYSTNSSRPSHLLLSAHSQEALKDVADAYLRDWPSNPRHAADFIAAASHLRDPLPHRAIILGSEIDEIRLKLQDFARTQSVSIANQALGNALPVTFLFSGNGSQWPGMGRAAWHTNSQFREALQELGGKFVRRGFASPADLLFAEDLAAKLRRATVAQPLLLAVQVAIVRALEAHGLVPAAALGHSVGEISAAWAAGALSLDQAIDVVAARSRNLESIRGRGAMAALMLSERDARRMLTVNKLDSVDIAAVNSWRSVTVSGSVEQINELVRVASEARVGARRLDLDYPYHSGIVDPVRAPLLRELQGLTSAAPRKRFVSSTTGSAVEQELLDAEHWWRNVRDPVRFDAALNCLLADGMQLFVEVGPKPILLSYVRDSVRDTNARGIGIETLTESDAEGEDPIERCVARVFAGGGQVEMERLFGAPPPLSLPLPAYPWRHSQYKIAPTAEASTMFLSPAYPLIGKRLRQDSLEWYSTVDTDLFPWLRDHAVEGVAVFPAAGYVEAALAAAAETYEDPAVELRELDIIRPLVFDKSASFETLVRLNRETGLLEILSRQRGAETDWALNARAIVGRCSADLRQCPTESGPVIVPKTKVYEASKKLGFDYGPAFQRVSRVSFPEAKRAVAVLEEGSALAGALHVSDLTALDAAFHALFASEEAGVADMAMKRMLPIRFGRVRAYKKGAVARHAVARILRQSPSSMVANIELVDAEGSTILFAEMVRLVEAPVAAGLDASTLTYRTASWELSRPLVPSGLAPRSRPQSEPEMAGEALSEALLLLEAGCLRATWAAFRSDRAVRVSPEQLEEETDWPAYLASSQLWHLETKNLVQEQDGELALVEACDLPAVPAVVRSLLMRHPTMAGEAASLSRLSEIMDRLVAGEISAKNELSSSHWRQLDVISEQISALRSAIEEELAVILQRRPQGQFVRLLLIGAHHSAIIAQRLDQASGVEVLVTDFDTDRLEQVSAALGDEAGFVRCVPWSDLDGLAPGSIDLVGAVDSLSEIAASADGLSRLKRLLRPRAPLIAGEPAPSLFWDLIRGVRPSWWARSANSDFPVGALLTGREWVDELRTGGFSSVSAEPALGEEGIGVILHALSDGHQALDVSVHAASWGWAGQETTLAKAVREVVDRRTQASKAEEGPSPESAKGVIWTIEARQASDLTGISTVLAQLAECAQVQASVSAPFSVLVDLGDLDHPNACLANPVWTAVTAALRVAQNEYPGIVVRCIGAANRPGATPFLESVAEELVSPSDECEVCFVDGKRTVFRLARGVANPTPRPELPSDCTVQLIPRSSSTRGTLVWTAQPRRRAEAGKVEIEVKATGLNFRDVMWNLGLLPEEALEDGYAGASLGMECAGVVTAVGPGETRLSPGDRVVAFVSGGFTSHVIAPAFALRKIPSEMSFEAAATIPVAFLTAYYSLVHLAELKRGETVLVHGGAGAVGLAALQVAQLVGATVIATAGSDEKRALLRDLGAQHVLNSRTLAFADQVMEHTQGKGVDVVLNSLAGEAMVRSMECLRPFGRFIELGKRDFYANTHIGLRPFRRNLTYHGVDVDQLLTGHRELTGQLFGEVLQRFETGQFIPLPHRVFSGDQIAEAFRFMQRSGHIGKIVVRPADRPTDTPSQSGRFPVSVDGWHVIVGGTSGFGFATAQWLADRGARYLVLASRSGTVAEELGAKVAELKRAGVTVDVAALDVSDYTDCEALLTELQQVRPVKGIVHAAMVLEDRLIENLDEKAIENVLAPKVGGALNLEMLSGEMKLDYLLLFSSATTLLGNPGQFNYVAANAYLEGLASKAQQAGIPALAVAWGAIEDTGYLARNIENNASLRKRFASSLVSARQALNGLDLAFDADGKPAVSALSIAQIDWSMAKRELAVSRASFFGAVVPGTGSRQSIDAAATLEKLKGLPLEEAAAVLLDMVVDEIARVLRLPPKEVDRHRPLAEIGMDSLMMLELRATVETTLQVDLPMMSLANGITPADIARRVAGLLLGADQPEKVSGRLMALSGSHLGTEVEQVDSRERLAAAKAVVEQSNKLQGSL